MVSLQKYSFFATKPLPRAFHCTKTKRFTADEQLISSKIAYFCKVHHICNVHTMLAILKYDAGNIHSVLGALHRLGADPVLTDDEDTLRRADKILFPGQGQAATTMAALRRTGLDKLLPQLQQPVLGICVGMQLLCQHSEEADTPCLGIIPACVKRFQPQTADDKIPHMGWNTLDVCQPDMPLLAGLNQQYVYYVHSYYVPRCPQTAALTTYCATDFSAILHHQNFYACQFHPEKSGAAGERLLRNFLSL